MPNEIGGKIEKEVYFMLGTQIQEATGLTKADHIQLAVERAEKLYEISNDRGLKLGRPLIPRASAFDDFFRDADNCGKRLSATIILPGKAKIGSVQRTFDELISILEDHLLGNGCELFSGISKSDRQHLKLAKGANNRQEPGIRIIAVDYGAIWDPQSECGYKVSDLWRSSILSPNESWIASEVWTEALFNFRSIIEGIHDFMVSGYNYKSGAVPFLSRTGDKTMMLDQCWSQKRVSAFSPTVEYLPLGY